MKYNKVPVLFFILFFIVTSCIDIKQNENVIKEYSNSYKFTVCDSIDLLDFNKGYVTAYLPKQDAFIGVFDKCIVGFNRNGEVFRLKNFGMGPNDFHYRDPSEVEVQVLEDSLLMINCYKHLKIFNLKGKIIKQRKLGDAPWYFNRKILGITKDNCHLVFEGTYVDTAIDMGSNELTSRNSFHFFTNHIKDNINEGYAFFEKENFMASLKKTKLVAREMVFFNKEANKVDVLYSPNESIFSYRIGYPKEYEFFKLNPEHFKYKTYPVSPSPLTVLNDKDYYRQVLSESIYYFGHSTGDSLFTVYNTYVDENIIKSKITPSSTINDLKSLLGKRDGYLEYYLNYKKQCNDIILPEDFKVQYILNSKKIIAINRHKEITKEGKAYKRFYFCKIEAI
ncbi:MAG: hypothetical protein ACEPOV_11670 [Hyphomicrobiales bacterium]